MLYGFIIETVRAIGGYSAFTGKVFSTFRGKFKGGFDVIAFAYTN